MTEGRRTAGQRRAAARAAPSPAEDASEMTTIEELVAESPDDVPAEASAETVSTVPPERELGREELERLRRKLRQKFHRPRAS